MILVIIYMPLRMGISRDAKKNPSETQLIWGMCIIRIALQFNTDCSTILIMHMPQMSWFLRIFFLASLDIPILKGIWVASGGYCCCGFT